ncbi:MAG TPA: hypothetical protein D7I12_02140 [Candidatus Poseidoniales archaeon]|nr:MAG TPA: hypothetical protein D7I12_02140 [Candidatus Poseidoniales archaeon]
MRRDEDSILRNRSFMLEGMLELTAEVDSGSHDVVSSEKEEDIDEAFGAIPDAFVQSENIGDGGSGAEAAFLRQSERKISWAMMSIMVIVYSALSLLIGLVLDPLAAIPLLLLLASFGLFLGERWIGKGELNLLGVTWVIISMKILYGTALELNRWEVGGLLPIGLSEVGIALCMLVIFNVLLAYRHNSDAIAAQATLVLLAIGSTAGSVAGEDGVIAMILVAVLLLHGLAIHRSSGNLASLGIAASNLWVGMHALTDGFEIGSLTVVSLDHPLKLFMAMVVVNGTNAMVATRFSSSPNWFSSALEHSGIAKPGLWGISVMLSMIGALMVVGSVRENLAFASAIILLLAISYFSSYLVVRGSSKRSVWMLSSISLSCLIATLLGLENGLFSLSLDPYWAFSAGGAIALAGMLVVHQGKVSNTVLWTGSIGISVLLLVLIPLDGSIEHGLAWVLVIFGMMHAAGGWLAIKRGSASLAGVAALTPWIWPTVLIVIDEVGVTFSSARSSGGAANGALEIGGDLFVAYLAMSLILSVFVCSRFGDSSLNISSGIIGTSEISASIKQSGTLNLWNLALWIPVSSTALLFLSGYLTSLEAPLILMVISIGHAWFSSIGIRPDSSMSIPIFVGLGGVLLQWIGADASMLILVIAFGILVPLALSSWESSKDWVGLCVQSGPVLLLMPGASLGSYEASVGWIPDPIICAVLVGIATSAVGMFRTSVQNSILPVATVIMAHSSMLCVLTVLDGRVEGIATAFGVFGVSSIWFVTRGEILRELKAIAERDRRREEVLSMGSSTSEQDVHRPVVEVHKSAGALGQSYVDEVRHFPMIAIGVIGIVCVSLVLASFILGPQPILVLSAGSFLVIIVALEGARVRRIGVGMSNTLGSDATHAVAVIGMGCAIVFGHTNPSSSVNDLTDLGVAIPVILLLGIATFANGKKGLLERRSVVDWIVYPLTAIRVAGFVIIGSLPAPLSVDPLEGGLLEWVYPFMLLEFVLILAIILDVLVDAQSRKGNSNVGVRNGFREVVFVFSIILLSWGPAGILAVMRGLYSSMKDRRTREAGAIALLLPVSIVSLEPSLSFISSVVDSLIIGELLVFMLILFAGMFVNIERWVGPSVQNAHILLLIVSLTILRLEIGVILLILVSSVVWSYGILKLRRGLRVLGLVDLSIASFGGVMLWLSDMSATWLLILTTSVSIELAIILWLSQRDMEVLEID